MTSSVKHVTFVVDQIWRYPIKSMGGEQLELSYADERGLLGDRVWAVQDDAGKLSSGKDSRRFRLGDDILA